MGAVDHERIVPLYTESTSYQTESRRDPWTGQTIIGKEIPGSRVTKRTDLTPAEAWDRVASAEAYEDGHSYSGNFGSKMSDGFVVAGRADVDLATLRLAAEAVRAVYYEDTLTPEQTAAARLFSMQAIEMAAAAFEDKWGPVAALVGRDHVWFGGSCPS